jgi:hypothetical protein
LSIIALHLVNQPDDHTFQFGTILSCRAGISPTDRTLLCMVH